MRLVPAIDLLDGKTVRLYQGNFREVTEYEDTPLDLAKRYFREGAKWLHVVDLAASRDGETADTEPLFRLLHDAPQKVQTGGGVRSGACVRARLDQGANRVVIGSLCVTETDRVADWLRDFGPKSIVAALDVRLDKDGTPRPRIFGWTEGTDISLWSLLDRLGSAGLRHVLVTDIKRDGAMHGPNISLYQRITERFPDLRLQASGGVGNYDDLKSLVRTGASSVIVGKSLLEGNLTVPGALEVLK